MSPPSGRQVPKFGSFKPRAGTKESISKTKRDEGDRHRPKDNRRSNKRHSDTQISISDHTRERPDRKFDYPRSKSPQQTPSEAQNPEAWMTDTRGDPQNVQFGSLHRYSVPQYHRAGGGSVIGLPPRIKIDRHLSTETGIVFRITRSTGEVQDIHASRSLSFMKTETEAMDDGFLEFDDEHETKDEQKPAPVGVGIWKFIEAEDNSQITDG